MRLTLNSSFAVQHSSPPVCVRSDYILYTRLFEKALSCANRLILDEIRDEDFAVDEIRKPQRSTRKLTTTQGLATNIMSLMSSTSARKPRPSIEDTTNTKRPHRKTK